jgi:dolichol-phosphate mannosyltransferase
MSYSVILPTFNENNHIIDLIKSISNIFLKQNILFEVLVIDDNSTDGTEETVKKFSKTNKYLNLISRKNKKKNLAESINDGLKKAKYINIIWMDADFQHPPKYILKFIELSLFNDVMICSRFLTDSERYFNEENSDKEINENQSHFFNKLCNFFLFKEITDYTSGFICIKKKLIENYELNGFYGDYFVSLITYLKKKNIYIHEIPFKDELRASGFSKTVVKINIKYVYLCSRYLLTLVINILKKIK